MIGDSESKPRGGLINQSWNRWYVDLAENPDEAPQPIHLGLRLGTNHLRDYLNSRQEIGVNHIALNLRFNQADIEMTMKRLADDILPDFNI